MSNCSHHNKHLFGETDMKIVADAIGDLHYEALAELLNRLAEKLWNDRIKNEEAGRLKLAHCLLCTYSGIHKASYGAERAWEVSKPFMDNTKISYVETFRQLRETEVGKYWNNIICVCRGLLKDKPCDLNCKEFNDESLTNEANNT